LEGDDDEEMDRSVVLLQRLLRGRAMQNDFYEGRDRCHGLIAELQAAQSAIDREAQGAEGSAKERIAEGVDDFVEGSVDVLVGDLVFDTLDYLQKELIRQQQHAAMSALCRDAEIIRAAREEEETQKRNEERALRTRRELQHDVIMEVMEYSAQTFVDEILSSSAASAAHQHALATVLEQTVAVESPQPTPPPEGTEEYERWREHQVCDLLDEFVLPQVRRNVVRSGGEHALRSRAVAETALEGAATAFPSSVNPS